MSKQKKSTFPVLADVESPSSGRGLSILALLVAIAALTGSGWLVWQNEIDKQRDNANLRVGINEIIEKLNLLGAVSGLQQEHMELINEDQLNTALGKALGPVSDRLTQLDSVLGKLDFSSHDAQDLRKNALTKKSPPEQTLPEQYAPEKSHSGQTPPEQNLEWQPEPEDIPVSEDVFNQTFLPNRYSGQNSDLSDNLFTNCRIEEPQRTGRKSKAESFSVFLGKDQLFAWFVMEELLNKGCTGVSGNREISKTLGASETCASNCHLNPYTDVYKQYYQEVYQQRKTDKVVWLRKSLEILIEANSGKSQEFLKTALEESLLVESISLRPKTQPMPELNIKPVAELVPESIQLGFARNTPFAITNITAFETVKASHTLLAGSVSVDWRTSCYQMSCIVSSSRWDSMSRRFNEQIDTLEGKEIIETMTKSVNKMEGLTLEESAQKVHKIMNKYRQRDDLKRYKEPEFWATPIEFLAKKRSGPGGDCEDYVIAKYVALRMLGVPKERLQLLAVEHHNYKGNKENYDHAVLVVYTDNDALILDSLRPDALSINHQDILRDYTLKYAVPSITKPHTQIMVDVPLANDKKV